MVWVIGLLAVGVVYAIVSKLDDIVEELKEIRILLAQREQNTK